MIQRLLAVYLDWNEGSREMFIFRLAVGLGIRFLLVGLYYSSGYHAPTLDTRIIVLLTFEIISYAAVQSSDPGYVTACLGIPSESSEMLDNYRNPLVPLEWDRKAWKPGPGIDDRLPPAPDELRAWCEICRISPPLRAQHCRVCNRCVSQYELHNFLCGCVGERNRVRYFIWVTSATFTVGSILQGLLDGYVWVGSGNRFGSFLSSNGSFICLASVFWGLFLFFAFSFIVNICLLASNLTYYEATRHRYQIAYLRGYSGCDLPYNRGLVSNLGRFFAGDELVWRLTEGFRTRWEPAPVSPPGEPDRDSKDLCASPWENEYYRCC